MCVDIMIVRGWLLQKSKRRWRAALSRPESGSSRRRIPRVVEDSPEHGDALTLAVG